MSPTLKHVDPNRSRGPLKRAYAALANTRLGRFFSIHVLWKLDPLVMRATGGRLGSGLGLIPTGLLQTRGAKSGALRRNTVIYFHDGERVTIVASKLGMSKHPAWFHNLVAVPALRDLPPRSGGGEPDDPDRPAHRVRAGRGYRGRR